MQELDSEDQYTLLKAQMDADKKSLEAQRAQQDLDRLVLELERKYELIGDRGSIDPRTATIQRAPTTTRVNGKRTPEELFAGSQNEPTD